MFPDLGEWLIGWGLMTVTLVAWVVWRSKTATTSRARRVVIVAAATGTVATISLSVAGFSSTTFPMAIVSIAILVIECCASMVGARARPDTDDDAPTARAIERNR